MYLRSILIFLVMGLAVRCAVASELESTDKQCVRLIGLSLDRVQFLSAKTVEQGKFGADDEGSQVSAAKNSRYALLPAFCRVVALSRPASDSNITIEIWMPLKGWNGKFEGQGNGGFGGVIDYDSMASALGSGYATAATDTGHRGSPVSAEWARGHPEKIIDFGFRAIHEMTRTAKFVVEAFYLTKPRYSYFCGCSNGGRQALMEAQRFPEDYDGILAGDPVNYWTHLFSSGLWEAQITTLKNDDYIPAAKLPVIARNVNKACDATDGIINDPRQCRFDPSSLVCNGSEDCLTQSQAETLRKLYQGLHTSDGTLLYPGLLPGAEAGRAGWELWITGTKPSDALIFTYVTQYFANMVYPETDWNYRSANVQEAIRDADRRTASALNAGDPDLRAFRKRGGKLVIYHGWNDPAASALGTIEYFDAVVKVMGRNATGEFVRFFLIPGIQHCGGGPGPDWFGQPGTPDFHKRPGGLRVALEQWVENRSAPLKITATKYMNEGNSGPIEMSRPICPYPFVTKYKGTGDANSAENVDCARHAQ